MIAAALPLLLAAGGELNLEVGEQRVIEAPGVQRCELSDASSHELITEDANHLRIVAVQPTTHTILCWNAKGERLSWQLKIRPRAAAGGTVILEVGRPITLKAPGVTRCEAGDGYTTKLAGKDAVLVTATDVVQRTLSCSGAPGVSYSWKLDVQDKPGSTVLRAGEQADIGAEGIESGGADDLGVVKVEVTAAGVTVTALKPGATNVRVKTKAGPIVHRFEVR